MSRRWARNTDKQPEEPRRIESPGGFWGGAPYEQIIDEDGKPVFLVRISNKLLRDEAAGWKNDYVIDTFILDSNEEPPIQYMPMKRLPWLPTGPLPEEKMDKETLWVAVNQFLFEHLDLPDPLLYDVFTAWVFATWVPERWISIPYLFFFGPVNSGKTRALDCLAALCYRGLQGANMSGASIFRGVEMWHPTLLLDETEIYNQEARADVIGILNAGYRRGQYAIRIVKIAGDALVIGLFDVFGFKALAGTREQRETLESRSIIIHMFRASRKIRFMIDREEARKLRTQLLLWRMEQFGEIEGFEGFEGFPQGVSEVPEDLTFADGRFAEKYYPLYTVANEGRVNIIEYARKVFQLEQLAAETSIEAEVTQSIIKCHDKVVNGVIGTREIAQMFNEPRNEKEQWKTQSVGRVVSRLGFHKKRTNTGRAGYIWDENILERNTRRYGLLEDEETPLGEPSNPSIPSKGWIDPAAIESETATIGDFYPKPLVDEWWAMEAQDSDGPFIAQIKVHAPDWPDHKCGALVDLAVEQGYLLRRSGGGLMPAVSRIRKYYTCGDCARWHKPECIKENPRLIERTATYADEGCPSFQPVKKGG